MWDIDLPDTDLDLLDKDIPSKHFVCLQDVFKISSRHVFKTSSRRLQLNNFSSSKTSSRRICKTSLRHVLKTNKCLLGNNFNFLHMSWVFYLGFSFSGFHWKFKILSIRNYNQHFTFKKAWEKLCRNFISYFKKSFEFAVINRLQYCHEIHNSCTKIRILIKDGSGYHLMLISFNRLHLAERLIAPFG